MDGHYPNARAIRHANRGDAGGPATCAGRPAQRSKGDNRDETRLARGGFDQIDINAEVIVQARELFAMFDQLTQSAQPPRHWSG